MYLHFVKDGVIGRSTSYAVPQGVQNDDVFLNHLMGQQMNSL